MSATVAAARPVSPTRHTVHRLAALSLFLAAWFWAIAVVAVVLATLVAWLVNGRVDVSIAVYARQAAIWFPFSQAIMVVAAYLRVHVASGMTRRTFARAALLVTTLSALGYAVVLTALVLAERALHHALGWQATVTEVQLADAASPAWMQLVDLAVPFVVGNLSGLVVGVVYQRLGGWWGTLALPLTVGPVLLTAYVGSAGLAGLPGVPTTTDAGHLALTGALGIVLAAALATVFAVTTRRLPLSATA